MIILEKQKNTRAVFLKTVMQNKEENKKQKTRNKTQKEETKIIILIFLQCSNFSGSSKKICAPLIFDKLSKVTL